jgi:hypothetical protein
VNNDYSAKTHIAKHLVAVPVVTKTPDLKSLPELGEEAHKAEDPVHGEKDQVDADDSLQESEWTQGVLVQCLLCQITIMCIAFVNGINTTFSI